jgi:hypothetical protein
MDTTTEQPTIPVLRQISRQAMWQKEQQAKGNCTSCGKPREDSTSKLRCVRCTERQRTLVRIKHGIPVDKPVRHWPREWMRLGPAEYQRRVRQAKAAESGAIPRVNRKWPKEWMALGQAEYQRRIRLAKLGQDPETTPKKRLRHPKEWRSLNPVEYQKLTRSAREQATPEQSSPAC